MEKKIAVVAFGGNAILPSNEHGSQEHQFANAAKASELVAEFLSRDYEVCLVHGNGPQVGNLLIQFEAASDKIEPYSLDVAVAMTQGSMGYMIDDGLSNQLGRLGYKKKVIALSSQVEVSPDDPGLKNPTKPVGPFYDGERAKELMKTKGWKMVEDSGRGWRKVVASPVPIRILGEEAAKLLVQAGFVVITGGGGGIPVFRQPDGTCKGVEAVIDKDYTASLLARTIKAEMFTILTEIDVVYRNFNKPDQEKLPIIPVSLAKKMLDEGQFPPGSMGPKIRAAILFIEAGGKEVLITNADSLKKALKGESGTRIVPDKK